MRRQTSFLAAFLAGAAALALASTAQAAPVTLEVTFSPEFQSELEEDYGVREGEYLRSAISDAIGAALSRHDGPAATVQVTVVDADPNRPTMQQLVAQPGLDAIRSISIGGAELHAVVRGADGQVLGEVDHRRYNYDLYELGNAATTWTEARRAIRQFARKVAAAYAENAR